MNCKNCGTQINQGEMFCRNCGASVEVNNQPVMQPTQPVGNVQPTMQPNQPMMNQQVAQPMPQTMNQPMGQPMMQPMMQQAPKKNNTGVIVLVAVVVVAVLVIGGVLLATRGKNDKGGNGDSNIIESNSNQGGEVTPVSTTTSKVRFKGFEFNIPTEYLFEIQTNSLAVTDNITWLTDIEVIDASYTTLVSRKEQIKLNMEKNGYIASTPVVKTYSGVQWITIEVQNGSSKAIIAYSQATASKVFGIVGYTKNNTIDYTMLDKIAPIVKTATYVGNSQSIKPNNFDKLDTSRFTSNLNK